MLFFFSQASVEKLALQKVVLWKLVVVLVVAKVLVLKLAVVPLVVAKVVVAKLLAEVVDLSQVEDGKKVGKLLAAWLAFLLLLCCEGLV